VTPRLAELPWAASEFLFMQKLRKTYMPNTRQHADFPALNFVRSIEPTAALTFLALEK
jgi:hypothetical protein